MSMAASPTAVMVTLAIRKGTRPPMKRPTSTSGLPMCSRKLAAAVVGNRFDEGGDDGKCRERRRPDRESLAHGGGGVAEFVEGVGDLAGFLAEAAHLRDAAGVVRHGP